MSGAKLILTMTSSPSFKSIPSAVLTDGASRLPSCPPLYSFKKTFVCILGCCGSSLLCRGFLWLREQGPLPSCGARVSHGGTSPVAEHLLWSSGSVAVAHGAQWSRGMWILWDRGSNLCPLHWQKSSLSLDCQGSSCPFSDWSRTNYSLNRNKS